MLLAGFALATALALCVAVAPGVARGQPVAAPPGSAVVIVQPSPFTFREGERLVASAMNHGLGTIFAFRDAVRVGALMAYGPDYADLNRRAASYLARILKGTRPGDLPVEQPTKCELLINLRMATALSLTIPPSLPLQADHVVE